MSITTTAPLLTTENVTIGLRNGLELLDGIEGATGQIGFGIGHTDQDNPSTINLITEAGEHFVITVTRVG